MTLSPTAGVGRSLASVCLDGRNQALPNGTGVQTYAKTLAAGLQNLGRTVEVLLDGLPKNRTGGLSRYARAALPLGSRASRLATAPQGFSGGWVSPNVFRAAQVYFDLYGRLHRVRCNVSPGIMHWTYPLPMIFAGVPNIYTVHDMIPLTHPSLTSIDTLRFARIMREVARHADHIITVSEASRRDIITLLDLPEEKVTNTYQAVTLPGRMDDTGLAPRCEYFLFCGTLESRKNLARLIAAYEASGIDTPLILVGPDGNETAELLLSTEVIVRPLAAMDSAGQRGVWRLAWLERPALLELFRKARGLLFPSLAEGFGLPIVEAMALGVPVLTSRIGATAEIAGGAAVLVDPTDIQAMAEAIRALNDGAELRSALVAKGLVRASQFSADAYFARLDRVYRNVEVASP